MRVDVQVETAIDGRSDLLRRSRATRQRAGGTPTSSRWTGRPRRRSAIGSRVDFVAQFLGRRLTYTYEVVELEPDRRLVMRTTDGPMPWRPPTPGNWRAPTGPA